MEGMGQTLTRRFGPLPVWGWFILLVGAMVMYLSYRKKKQQQAAAAQQQQQPGYPNAQTNLGTTPISNLSTQAQPMPLTLGDTFVNSATPTGSTGASNTVASTTGVPGTTVITPTIPAQSLSPQVGTNAPMAQVGQTPPASGGVQTAA